MTDVEPPVVETEPAAAAELFGTRIDLARRFTGALAEHGEERGLIGPLELPRLWTRHVLNCALMAPLLRPGRVADIGSGAGLPGLVLAISRPDVTMVLVEPMERRIEWLQEQTSELGLDNVEIVRARAEEIPFGNPFDQVTARAVSALSKLVPMTARLVRQGGELVFLKGASVEKEIEAAAKAIRKADLHDIEVLELGTGVLPEVTRVFRAKVGTRPTD